MRSVLVRVQLKGEALRDRGCSMRVLVAARDIRVRRALSSLLELHGDEIVGATGAPRLLAQLDAEIGPDLVVLELSRRAAPQEMRTVAQLARRGRAVIAVCSRSSSCAQVLAAGARACLEKDAQFADRLAEALRAVTGRREAAPPPP